MIDNTLTLQNFNTIKIEQKTDNDTALKEQTDKFEAFLIKKILDISIKHENSLFPKDPGNKIYNSMYNDAVSNSMSGKFGFSELLFNFLKENR